MKITGYLVVDSDGEKINADPHGNNLAFCCSDCGHPILAIALANQRGSDKHHPATCKGCGVSFFMDVHSESRMLSLYKVETNHTHGI